MKFMCFKLGWALSPDTQTDPTAGTGRWEREFIPFLPHWMLGMKTTECWRPLYRDLSLAAVAAGLGAPRPVLSAATAPGPAA